jgi:hypothetical protein
MPGNIHLSVDGAQTVQVGMLLPTGLGTIAVTDAEHGRIEGVARFHAVRPLPGYDHLVVEQIQGKLQPGQLINALGVGVGSGPFQEIAVVEVLLAPGRSLSEQLVASGLAIPDPELLASHLRREELTQALAQARLDRVGYWKEYSAGQTAPTLLGAELALATQPPPAPPEWFSRVGLLLILLLFIGLTVLGRQQPGAPGRLSWFKRHLLGLPQPVQGGLRRIRELHDGGDGA